MKRAFKQALYFIAPVLFLAVGCRFCLAAPIDRQALVNRHSVVITQANARHALQVGNGEFAFGVDVTGLQTFYGNSLSQWGWHAFPFPKDKKVSDYKLRQYESRGRTIGYATDSKTQVELYNWLRENPHRLNLGKLGLRLSLPDGKIAGLDLKDISQTRQELDLWRGIITSRYSLKGDSVQVMTVCDPAQDMIAVRIESSLVKKGQLSVALEFPYGATGATGADWTKPSAHKTEMTARGLHRVDFKRQLDADNCEAGLSWTGDAKVHEEALHLFVLKIAPGNDHVDLIWAVSKNNLRDRFSTFDEVRESAARHWNGFWQNGGAIDLSESKDPRWKELERRIVLSQYLLAVNEAGSLPPQESGLFNNSGWYGKFHLEMHWWHGAHYALWNRWPLFERSLGWYEKIVPEATALAESQGFKGARWPKMVGPEGRDSPSGVGPLLLWQQPHPIFYADLDYRLHPDRRTLEKWTNIVFRTAEFMASFAEVDNATGKYSLNPPLKTAPENTDPLTACNPGFELSYWRYGLRTAQQWRERLGMARVPEWDKVLQNLAPLPVQDGVYLSQQGMTDTYTKWNWEHPSLIGPLGMLPGDGADPAVMKATVRKVWNTWQWDRKTWGWDFPMLAMAAARNGEPRIAVDALLHPAAKNAFEINGLSAGGPYPYFPSNGGLLYAVALMAAGWEDPFVNSQNTETKAATRHAPGFPDDGSWIVRWEGLKKAP